MRATRVDDPVRRPSHGGGPRPETAWKLAFFGLAAVVVVAAAVIVPILLKRQSPPPRTASLPKLNPPVARQSPTVTTSPATPPPTASPAQADARQSADPTARERPSDTSATPRPTPRRGPANAPTYESLCQQFGADRVARVTLSGIEGLALHTVLYDGIQRASGGGTPQWRFSVRGNEGDLLIGPIGDVTALLEALDLGTTTSIDLQQRVAVVAVDRSKVPAMPMMPNP